MARRSRHMVRAAALAVCARASVLGVHAVASNDRAWEQLGGGGWRLRGSEQNLAVPGADEVVEIKPQIFLLFMVYTKINNQAVWERFFDGAVRGEDYIGLVHCVDEARCRQNIPPHHFEVINTVPTRYCFDLVSGMNALLRAALLLGGRGHARDKFVFLSDSTLPVKPFRFIHSQLTADEGSDICVFPRNEWAKTERSVAPKHHQWMVLSRRHALAAVQHANEQADLMEQLRLNRGIMRGGDEIYTNTGCLDEFWHFATLYRDVDFTTAQWTHQLEGFNGGPLTTSNLEIQGKCDTFVHWVPRANGIANNVTALAHTMSQDVGTDLSLASDSRPASMNRLGRVSLVAMRESSFLFARKVEDGASFSGCESLPEAFSKLVFSAKTQPLQSDNVTWRGQGVWLDNLRAPVAISSANGAARLSGNGQDMSGKGFYCGDWLHVTFSSGYQTTAVVSQDGLQLRWSNGVVWPRAPLSEQHDQVA